ncbi:hypothetical protein GN156_00560 [bacterium LRH843]|nr:hypothetical protein [bacterium LRH843]
MTKRFTGQEIFILFSALIALLFIFYVLIISMDMPVLSDEKGFTTNEAGIEQNEHYVTYFLDKDEFWDERKEVIGHE